MQRLLLAGAALIAAAAVTAVVVVSGGLATSSAKAASPGDGLSAYVVLTNRGPLPPCSTLDDCTAANFTWEYVHIINSNTPSNEPGTSAANRTNLPNSFVLDSVDETILVNGAVFGQDTYLPPPNTDTRFGTAGHWPATVTCGAPVTLPCGTVLNPAILPGENTVGFFDGWFHGSTEPTGSYVFRFTFHGRLNGAPVDLTADSKSIQMT
jgi:hypothetical protein